MLLSWAAPEKHPYLVCRAYSEVTISKNSFLKISLVAWEARKRGVEPWSTLFSCFNRALQAEGETRMLAKSTMRGSALDWECALGCK